MFHEALLADFYRRITVGEPPGEQRPRVLAFGSLARGASPLGPRGLVCEQLRDAVGESVGVTGRDESACLLGHDLLVARDVRGYARRGAREGARDRHAEALVAKRR